MIACRYFNVPVFWVGRAEENVYGNVIRPPESNLTYPMCVALGNKSIIFYGK